MSHSYRDTQGGSHKVVNCPNHPNYSGVTEEVGLVDNLVVMFDSCSQLMLTIISCIGIPGNIMVLIVILTTPEMRHKVFNMFIVHQSVIDLLACVGTLLLQYFNDMNSVKDGKGTRENGIIITIWAISIDYLLTILNILQYKLLYIPDSFLCIY